jgi:HPr kinase/phosphorylase
MDGLPRTIHSTELHRPALALTGFVDLYTFDRGQVLGNTELLYLNSLNSQERRAALEIIYQFDLPCVIITNGYEVLPELLELSEDRGVPLLTTTLSTARFIHQFLSCLDDYFAPRTTMHGTMVDVYGVGLLLTGRSSIGKSEIALDLVERGHRLVADDVVHITRQRNILRGESSPMLGQKMEIRGIGIIDVQRLFGIRAIRKAKRVEVVLNLVQWSDEETYERIGLSHGSTCILGVEIPMIQLPIFPGKNITVIAETIAMNHLLRIDGYSAAEELNIRLSDALKQRTDGPSTYGMMEEEH